ncbi:hypothetical protein K7Q63_002856 [Enterococcus faecalis]|nr:hypothetical protein [Enterococcus faecalis]EGO2696479.1 hypothetical protein [Enterococcus faecalis]EHS7922899.1 hypothetical protein [Enterococcus faecalis]EIA6631602.1 hypothetical protein [Enterococcus faecalis]EIA6945499.1 hypothetical protein [Enterococcus faecalis]
MKVFNLICVRKTEFENRELILTNPLGDVMLPSLSHSFSFEIAFGVTEWKDDSQNQLRVTIEDSEESLIFDSSYIDVPRPEHEICGVLGLKLNDFEFSNYGKHTVKIIENDNVIADTIFFISERSN